MLERGTLFSAFERSVDRRLSFLTLVVFLPSAVAFLVQTKFQTVSPGYDILDEPSDKAAASLFYAQCARRVEPGDALALAFQCPISLTGHYRFLRADSKVRRRTSSRDFYFSCSPHASHFAPRLIWFSLVGEIATELRHTVEFTGVPIWASPSIGKTQWRVDTNRPHEKSSNRSASCSHVGIVKAASAIMRVGPQEAAPSL